MAHNEEADCNFGKISKLDKKRGEDEVIEVFLFATIIPLEMKGHLGNFLAVDRIEISAAELHIALSEQFGQLDNQQALDFYNKIRSATHQFIRVDENYVVDRPAMHFDSERPVHEECRILLALPAASFGCVTCLNGAGVRRDVGQRG